MGIVNVLAMLMIIAGDPQSATQPVVPRGPAGFLYRTIEFNGETFAYCVYVPPEYDPARPWPVILFLHGSGERGTDGLVQTEVGVGKAIRQNRALVPAIVVMPQCREGQRWADEMAAMALRCVEATSADYNLDPQRVYLTGLSMGGAGTWWIAARHAEKFAAIAPICGFGETSDATALAKVPAWVFHGAKDDLVPVAKSREMVEAIRAAGGRVSYTEYPEANHNSWDKTYRDREFWQWLFAQKRDRP